MTKTRLTACDCLEGLKEQPDESTQLTVTSPPYNIGKNYGEFGDALEIGQWKDLMNNLLNELFRVTKPDGKVVFNIGWASSDTDDDGRFFKYPLHSYIIDAAISAGFDYFDDYIWKKSTFHNSGGGALFGSYPYPTNFMANTGHEYILVFRKWVSKEYYSNRNLPPKGTERREDSQLSKEEWREYTNSVWEFPGVKHSELEVDHPAPFPCELPKRCVRLYSFKGDTILDPFIGTGTTAVVAEQLERDCIGFDINGRYIEYAKERVE